ncbi:MAG TPA: phosphoglycerate dehydrogenase [Phycisphaerae bacterium]|nr:phosphoglycerate dehydrogenase [Phycisphaerae bacterium]
MFDILVADSLAAEGLAILKDQPDVKLTVQEKWKPGELAGVLGNYDGVIIRSGVQIRGPELAGNGGGPGKLKAIARAGVGVDNVDVDAATKAGVLVMNTPDANTITTAEHAVALMMALSRKIPAADASLRAGKWDRKTFMGKQLAGKTIGIIGFGRIGRAVAKRALGLEMKVVAFDKFYFAETAIDGQVKMIKDFDALLPLCDYITLHTPGGETLLGAEQIAKCKKGVRFINAARGGLIDEVALAAAINSGHVAGAAIDVYEPEPPAMDKEIFKLGDKTVVTPHLGASTTEAQTAASTDVVAGILTYLRGEGLVGAVNAGGVEVNLSPQEKAYADLAQRMGTILAGIAEKGFDSITLRTNGELPKRIANTLQRLAVMNLLKPFLSENLNVVNAFSLAEARGINIRSETMGQAVQRAIQHSIELEITEKVNGETHTHTIIGTVFADNLPRVLGIKGYWMDMIPAGNMVLIVNKDKPGVIGLVGNTFGKLNINIADMTISRKGDKALMLLKVDTEPTPDALATLRAEPSLEVVKAIKLPALDTTL